MTSAQQIFDLLTPFVAQDLILPRTLAEIEQQLNEFITLEHNQRLIACAGLKIYPQEYGEIYAFAVHASFQKQGYSSVLLNQILVRARDNGMTRLFALSKYRKNWFINQGFALGELAMLPQAIHQRFDHHRCPQIFFYDVD